jgi:hypothetical protein
VRLSRPAVSYSPGVPTVCLDVNDLSERQLLLHVLSRINDLEVAMSSLTETVTELQGAIDGLAQRFAGKLAALETAQAALTQALADDQTDEAEIARLTAEIADATTGLRTVLDQANALGAEPSTPVDETEPNVDIVPDVEVVSEPVVDAEAPTDTPADTDTTEADAAADAELTAGEQATATE